MPGRARVMPWLEIFNVTHRNTSTAWVSQLRLRYQVPTTLQRSRLLKFEVAIDF